MWYMCFYLSINGKEKSVSISVVCKLFDNTLWEWLVSLLNGYAC